MGTPALGARPSRLQSAVAATRPLYLPTSVVPGLAGCLAAVGVEGASFAWLPVVLLAVLLVHAATDACNEAEDFANGVDQRSDKVENSGVFLSGALTVREGRVIYASLFLATFVLGVVLTAASTPWLLVYGVLGILGGWLYTGGPLPFKYVGLGDPFIVFLMGPLLTQGAYTAITGDPFDARAFWVGLVPGFLILSVLQSNNANDIADDQGAGIKTLAVRVGEPWAARLIAVSLVAAFLAPVLLVVLGVAGPWLLLVLLPAPVALGHARTALTALHEGLTPALAQLHLLTSAVLCVALVLDGL